MVLLEKQVHLQNVGAAGRGVGVSQRVLRDEKRWEDMGRERGKRTSADEGEKGEEEDGEDVYSCHCVCIMIM